MNWNENPWFKQHHGKQVTPEFQRWWVEYYLEPDQYGKSEEEQQEYWVRCSFALAGWQAALTNWAGNQD